MKEYEGMFDMRVMPLLPVMARLDGRSFHTFTKGMRRPYDSGMSECMIRLTKFMVEETGAIVGYTQSDEITLAWHSTNYQSQIFFDGRMSKMISILSAMASVEFNRLVSELLPTKAYLQPLFDCRVWYVPNRIEAVNVFLWRELDATKNAISMAAQALFSHKQLQGKTGEQKQEMLFSKGVNFNDYPSFFKRGTYVRKSRVERPFTTSEIEKLPAKHRARSNPNLMVERFAVDVMKDLPPLTKLLNREEVLFGGATPVLKE